MQHPIEKDVSISIIEKLPLTNNEMSYTHINSSQRSELSALLRTKTKQKEIAKLLKKHRTTVWRELKRNKGKKYHAGIAKEKTEQRQIAAH